METWAKEIKFSPDRRWRLETTTIPGRRLPCVEIDNLKLNATPCGIGSTEREAWEGFIARCDDHIGSIAKARDEARQILAAMDNAAALERIDCNGGNECPHHKV
jgi:hypothetical protein